MKLKPYLKYKDSGIEWLGKIPERWEVKKLKYLSDIVNGYAFDSESYADEGVPVIRIGDISDVINFDCIKKIPEDSTTGLDKFRVKYGDILLALTGATIGKTAIYNSKKIALLNQRVAILRGNKLNQKYLTYFIASKYFKENIDYLCYGGAQENIGKNDVGLITVSCPSFVEQQQIANFLDQKTAEIDELIKKNETLIELLKEKRQAIILQAVTKGLDPNAKMKDSGIEWIDEIPERWEVRKLKYVAQIILGKMLQNENFGGDQLKPYLRAQNIQWETVDISDIKEMWLSAYEIRKYRLQRGDLLISEGGEVGRTALWNNEIEECYIQNSVHRVTVSTNIFNNKYLLYLLEIYGKRGFFESIINRVSIGHLTREKLKEILIINPPLKEQDQIANYLSQRTSKIDNLIKKIESQNEKLKEYRQTLISNVVTGKVKVK